MKVVAGPSSPLLARRIADILNVQLLNATFRRFPDGELYVKIDGLEDETVIVQSINSNDDLVYLLLMLDAASDTDITAVVPYMGYARQDRAFKEGEAVSIRAVARLIESYADRVISVNLHSKEAASHFKKLTEIDAMPLVGRHFAGRDVVMISPDEGSYERVKVAARAAGCSFDYMEKRRLDADRVEIRPKDVDVSGKEVVIVDDIISTGSTVVEAAKMLMDSGASRVEVACVHAVLAGHALNRLFSSGIREVIATDTVERQISVISVAGEIARLI